MATNQELPGPTLLTVAALREMEKGDRTEALFNENHQILQLSADRHDEQRELLAAALEKGVPVKVKVDPYEGIVVEVEEASSEEIRRFRELHPWLEEPEEIRPIDMGMVDPTTFSIVDHYLKWPIFRRCRTVMPDYTTAKQIFDFCAQLSCHLTPPPPAVQPCIPFQYVRDGCYARAHQMRRIITERYGYCCEKIFSFAVDGNDRLAVKADKWGGCCVTWWYHVAPLVRVKVGNLFTVALVFDPSMFDKPVLPTTWLWAQENTTCNANANVSKYTIQPGSAYWPAGGSTTNFATDPNYVSTETWLNNYKNLITC